MLVKSVTLGHVGEMWIPIKAHAYMKRTTMATVSSPPSPANISTEPCMCSMRGRRTHAMDVQKLAQFSNLIQGSTTRTQVEMENHHACRMNTGWVTLLLGPSGQLHFTSSGCCCWLPSYPMCLLQLAEPTFWLTQCPGMRAMLVISVIPRCSALLMFLSPLHPGTKVTFILLENDLE